jgi:hypothetical protein
MGELLAIAATVFVYVIPGEGNYVQPTIAVDRESVHIEARYNYEARDAGSLWAGYNLEGGDTLSWAFTPMLGAVLGTVTGVATGYSGSLTWRKLDVYSEGEYLSDLSEPADSFFYNWSEVSLRPLEMLRFGLVTQRTRVRESARDLQRGPLVGMTFRSLELTAYMLDGGDSAPTLVMAAVWTFGGG